MSPQQEIFNAAIERFGSEQEEIRTSAAFAAGERTVLYRVLFTDNGLGNIAVGNLHHFLPVIVRMVETDPAKRLLSLHALKEVRKILSFTSLD